MTAPDRGPPAGLLEALGKRRDALARGPRVDDGAALLRVWMRAERVEHLVVLRAHRLHPPLLGSLAELATAAGAVLWLVWHDTDPPASGWAGEVWSWPRTLAAHRALPPPDPSRLRAVDAIYRAAVAEARREARLWRVSPPRQRRFTQPGCGVGALLQRLTIDATTEAELQMRLHAARSGFAAERLTLVLPPDPAASSVLGPRISAHVVSRLRRIGCPTSAAALLLALATDARAGRLTLCAPRRISPDLGQARDGFAVLALLDGRTLADPVAQAAALLATVLGQDLEEGPDNVFRIARRVAKDRVISTVDPDTRHGHKTSARGFDGYKGHAAVDPDSEIITATTVTPGNAGDASVAEHLIADLLGDKPGQAEPKPAGPDAGPGQADPEVGDPEVGESSAGQDAEQARVYGDNAYGTGSFHDRLGEAGIEDRCKTQAPTAAGGLFSKDRFDIDLGAGVVSCPGGITAPIRPARAGGGTVYFAAACPGCPLRTQCTTAAGGRTVSVGPHEQALTDARARQTDPAWVADYRGTRPKVERKLGHLMRRRHGGRRARVRGTARVDADFGLLAAAVNLARMAVLDLRGSATGWAVAI